MTTTTARLLQLPDELLIQLISSCEPLDLLHLSRTCQRLRSILHDDPSSETIWKTARSQYPPIKCRKTQIFPFGVSFTNEVEVPLPARFNGISERDFARLMFEDACTICSARKGTPYTALKRRLCQSCCEEHCLKRDDLLSKFQWLADELANQAEVDEWINSVRQHCARQHGARDTGLYWLADVEEHSKKCVQDGKVQRGLLNDEVLPARKMRERFEKEWREWIEAGNVVNERALDPRLARPSEV